MSLGSGHRELRTILDTCQHFVQQISSVVTHAPSRIFPDQRTNEPWFGRISVNEVLGQNGLNDAKDMSQVGTMFSATLGSSY